MRYSASLALAGLLVLFVGGCARYEYDLIRPEAHARHVGTRSTEVLTLDPLEYHLRTTDNRLVMLVYNHTDNVVQLVGGKSYVVSPDGQSHPLRSVPVVPGAFVKMILPPMRPRVERRGPTFGIGVGASSGGYHRSGVGVGVGTTVGDDYYYVQDDTASYWEWTGESDVRLNVVYQQNDREFAHEFLLRRRKM